MATAFDVAGTITVAGDLTNQISAGRDMSVTASGDIPAISVGSVIPGFPNLFVPQGAGAGNLAGSITSQHGSLCTAPTGIRWPADGRRAPRLRR